MCLYPRLIENAKYKPNKKNGGVYTPPLMVEDKRVLMVPVGCGQCVECRKKKSREWQIRLGYEIKKKQQQTAKFITLTFSNEEYTKLYNDELLVTKKLYAEYTNIKTKEVRKIKYGEIKIEAKGYDRDNAIAKTAVRRWLERQRKKTGKSIKHWLVTELGHNGTENIHLHGIIWCNETKEEIEETWKYGMIWIGDYVNERTINYIIKYTTKIDKDHKYYKARILTSAGIGSGYEESIDGKHNNYKENGETRTWQKTNSGHKMGLPIYWRNKIYTEEEREKLWIEMLNKKIRYIKGRKINIKENEETYKQLLKEAQEENIRDGYGTGDFNWEEKKYEEERRILKQQERLRA